MPKKQKRFKSEQAILKAIDVQDKKQTEKYAEADQIEDDVKAMTLHPEAYGLSDINWKRTLAGKARRSAQRAANKKVELGKALSAFRTMLLPMGEPDNSVVL